MTHRQEIKLDQELTLNFPPPQWLAGDVTNLLGAVWQGLLPTMIILAIYYSLCDIVLISQVRSNLLAC